MPLVLFDQFNGPDGQVLENHSMMKGGPWIHGPNPITNGLFKIEHNQCVAAFGTDIAYIADGGSPAGTLTVDVDLSLGDEQVMLFLGCNQDVQNNPGWAVAVKPTLGTPRAELYQYQGAGWKNPVEYAFVAGPQQWKVVLSSASLKFYIDNVLVITENSPDLYGDWWGINAYRPSGLPQSTFQQFRLTVP